MVYLFRQGRCIAFNSLSGKNSPSRMQAEGGISSGSITNPHAVFAIKVAHNTVFCSGKNGTLHCLDTRTLQKYITIPLVDIATTMSSTSYAPPSSGSKRGSDEATAAGTLVTGVAILTDHQAGSSGASMKVSKREKRVRLVAATNIGVAKYLCVSIRSGLNAAAAAASSVPINVDKAPIDLFHYHMGSLWGLSADHHRYSASIPDDAKLLVTAGDDRTVAVWNCKSMKRLCAAATQVSALLI